MIMQFMWILSIIICTSLSTNSSKKKGLKNEICSNADFLEVVKRPNFVDKSDYLTHIIRHGRDLITAPRRFGKSTQLDMAKKFLSKHVNSSGLFDQLKSETIRRAFEPLNVYKERFFSKHFGMYPVISVSFKSDVKIKDMNDAIFILRTQIRKAFLEHSYLLNTNTVKEKYKKFLNYWMNEKPTEVFSESIITALTGLSRLLYQYFKQGVFVLVDDYDSIVTNSLFNADEETYRSIQGVMRDIYDNLIVDNRCTPWSILTGVSSMHTMVIPYYVRYNSFLDRNSYEKSFGLNKHEVNALLNKTKSHVLKEVNLWYGGYVWKSGRVVYNLFSVLNYVKYGKLQRYWSKLDGHMFLDKSLTFQTTEYNVLRVSRNHPTPLTINPIIGPPSVLQICERVLYGRGTNMSYNSMFLFLIERGYLTYMKNRSYVTVPNIEMRTTLVERLTLHFTRNIQINEVLIRDCSTFITHIFHVVSDATQFKSLVKKFQISLLTLTKILNRNYEGIERKHLLEQLFFFLTLNFDKYFFRKNEYYEECSLNSITTSGVMRLKVGMIQLTINLIYSNGDAESKIALTSLLNEYDNKYRNIAKHVISNAIFIVVTLNETMLSVTCSINSNNISNAVTFP